MTQLGLEASVSTRRPNDATPLGEARDWLRERADRGERCPCCTQFAKVYKRPLNSAMALRLITFYREAGVGEWFHGPSLARTDGDTGKLALWRLVEEQNVVRPDGGRAGWWRVTDHGANFVRLGTRVPKYAHVYDGRLLRHSGPFIDIRDALGTKFNYYELMNS